MASFQNGKMQKLQGFQSNARTSFQRYKMNPGIYIVKVIMLFNAQFEKDFDVNLAVYGQYPCLISLSTNQQACAF